MGQVTKRLELFEHLKPALGWVHFAQVFPGAWAGLLVICPGIPGRADLRIMIQNNGSETRHLNDYYGIGGTH